MNKSLVFWEKIVAYATVFLLPTQLALHLWPEYSFVFGIRVDYLSVAFYSTDIFVAALLFLWALNDWKSIGTFYKERHLYIWGFILFAILNTAFSTIPPTSFYKWLKIIEVILLGVYFYRRKFVSDAQLHQTLLYSLVFFSLIAISQFLLGHTTGLFYILGERTFSVTTPGIALARLAGKSFLRVYSTFPHPNALAGFLGASLVWLLGTPKPKRNIWAALGMGVIALCLVLTFSQSTLLALGVVAMLAFLSRSRIIFKKMTTLLFSLSVAASLALPILSAWVLENFRLSENLFQRIDLSYISGKMISERFLTGEGANTFISNAPKFKGILNYNWFLQPVHNIFLLVFAETGIVGILIFFLLLYWTLKNFLVAGKKVNVLVFMFILITGLSDHYWLTIQQNLLFLSLFFGISLRERG